MRGTLLVIDGHGTSDGLVRHLERYDYFCFQARGPLKVRDVLRDHAVDAIVWKEAAGNAALDADLAGAWADHQWIPVVHLFSGAGAATATLPRQVVDSLPEASALSHLVPLLDDAIERARQQAAQADVEHTELAFRNIVRTLRTNRQPHTPQVQRDERFELPVTALNVAERESLRSVPPAGAAQRGHGPFHWLRRRRDKS